MELKDLLGMSTLNELKAIARNLGVRGYTKLKKDGLVDLLVTSMQDPQSLEAALALLTRSGQHMVSILVEKKGELEYYKLLKEFSQQWSKSTFYKAYRDLLDTGLIYEYWPDDETTLAIVPEEIIPNLEMLLGVTEATVAEEEEELEEEDLEEEIQYLDDFLSIFTTKVDLQGLLAQASVRTSGVKSELVTRLLYESGISPEEILDALFSKGILKEICREIGQPVSGTKPDLIQRILKHLPTEHERKVVEPEKAPVLAQKTKVKAIPREEKLMDEVLDILDNIPIGEIALSRKVGDKEKDIERMVLTALQTGFRNRPVEIKGQAVGVVGKKIIIPDITIDYNKICIEIKYISDTADAHRAIGQAANYADSYGDVILYVYDPNANFVSPKWLQSLSNLHIILRR